MSNHGMPCAIGIDIGGTKIAAGLVDAGGQVLIRAEVSTPAAGREEILRKLEEMVSDLLVEARRRGYPAPEGIGVGTAGQIDVQHGRVLSGTPNIRDWHDVPIADRLSAAAGLPVWVDNDVNVAVLAEWRFGAARGHMNFVCLTLGTGVGGGVMAGGRLLHGAWGGAAELGHMSVDLDGPPCNCGHRGCLEAYASGTGLALRMQEALAEAVAASHADETTDSPSLRAYVANPDCVTSEAVFRWYQAGDPLAARVVERMLRALASGIVNLIHAFNPTLVLLGGGLVAHQPWICDEVARRISGLGIRSLVEPVAVQAAALGPDAGLIGAASLCWTRA